MDTRRVSGVGQIPISKTDIIHLFNYDTQDVDGTVLRSTFGNQVLPHSLIQKSKHDDVSIQIPPQLYDKPCRVLSLVSVPSVLNVFMHGSFDLVNGIPLRFVCTYLVSSCHLNISRHCGTLKALSLQGVLMDDACLLHAANSCLVVLGHA